MQKYQETMTCPRCGVVRSGKSGRTLCRDCRWVIANEEHAAWYGGIGTETKFTMEQYEAEHAPAA